MSDKGVGPLRSGSSWSLNVKVH